MLYQAGCQDITVCMLLDNELKYFNTKHIEIVESLRS